jgi:hypothetical protein
MPVMNTLPSVTISPSVRVMIVMSWSVHTKLPACA